MWCWWQHVVLTTTCDTDDNMWCWQKHVVLMTTCGADDNMWCWCQHVVLTASCGADDDMRCWWQHLVLMTTRGMLMIKCAANDNMWWYILVYFHAVSLNIGLGHRLSIQTRDALHGHRHHETRFPFLAKTGFPFPRRNPSKNTSKNGSKNGAKNQGFYWLFLLRHFRISY